MKTRPLGRTGLHVSILSFGASSLGGVFRETDDAEGIRAVHASLDHGINFIDVSPYYGATRAETVLGKALRSVPRDRYILATKVGQYGEGEFDFSAARVRRSLDESCARLGVDDIDLLQCHDIEFVPARQILEETLPELLALKKEGRIGHIGITGLPLKCFTNVLNHAEPGVVETVLSFCHYTLKDTSLESLISYFQEKGVGIINASPTGMGLLTERGVPSWHPAPPALVEGCRRAVDFCRREGVDIVRLAIQFAVAHPAIATTLVGSASAENMIQNIRHAEAPLDEEMLRRVREILRPVHNHNFTRGLPENRDPILA